MHTLSKKEGARLVAFVQKTKKQAKNLFKLAQKNQLKIEVKNLSHAQEILANINGYPDWHALEKSVHHYLSENVSSNIVYNVLEMQSKEEVFFYAENGKVKSIINVQYLPTNYDKFIDLINNLVLATNFQYNTGFHDVSFSMEQKENSNHHKKEAKSVQYFSYHEEIGIEKKLFDRMFRIEIPNVEKKSLDVYREIQIEIATEETLLDEHIKFCKKFIEPDFKEYFSFATSKNVVENPDKKATFIESLSKRKKEFLLNDFLLENHNANTENLYIHNKWIHAIYLLCQKKQDWKIYVNLSLKPQTVFFYHSENEEKEVYDNNDHYINGLYKSIVTTNIAVYNKLPNEYNKTFQYDIDKKSVLPYKSGLPLVNVLTDEIEYYDINTRTNNVLIAARPGSGKSVLLNQLNLSSIFSSYSLPYIGVVDVGPSSSGLIELLKKGLLKKHAEKIEYHKFKAEEKYCVNVFDTKLGCRYPTSEHMDFLCNFLSSLLTENYHIGGYLNVPTNGLTDLIKAAVKEAYELYSDNVMPKSYIKGINPEIDNVLSGESYVDIKKTSWWEIVDILFKDKHYELAKIAQTYAVPLISDLSLALQQSRIKEIYSNVRVETGENLIQYFNRYLSDVVVKFPIFPLLMKPTKFNTKAKVLVCDIDYLCHSNRETNISPVVYMWASYIVSHSLIHDQYEVEKILYKESNNKNIPVKDYIDYHYSLDENLKKQKKLLCFDELHRAYLNKNQFTKQHFLSQMKNAQKFDVSNIYITQSMQDFTDDYVENSTAYFIMDSFNNDEANKVAKQLQLTNSEKELLGKIHGPRSNKSGVMFLHVKNYSKVYNNLMSLLQNNMLITALSTTSEDVMIRQKLCEKLNYDKAIEKINKHYPYGIRKIIENKRLITKKSYLKPDENYDNETNILIDQLVEEVINK